MIDPTSLTEDEVEMFTTEMREVVRAVNCSNDKEKYSKAVIGDDRFKSLHRETAELINIVTNLKMEIKSDEKEEVNMCKAMEELIEDGRKEGRKGDIRLLLKHLSESQVAEYLEISVDEVREAAKIPVTAESV